MRITLIEDHRSMCELLRKILEDAGHSVIAEIGNGFEAMGIIDKMRPDLVLLDLELPGQSGFTVLESLQKLDARPKVLVYSARSDPYTVYRLEKARVAGFLDKASSGTVQVNLAVDALQRGQSYFSESFVKLRKARRIDAFAFDKVLTARKMRILELVGDLLTDAEIAAHLGISERTVEAHRSKIQQKLGLSGRLELQRFSRSHGFADPLVHRHNAS